MKSACYLAAFSFALVSLVAACSSSSSPPASGTGGSTGGDVTVGDCPECTSPLFCCLKNVGGVVQGTCTAMNACTGGASVACEGPDDCGAGLCCATIPAGGGPAGSVCTNAATCPATAKQVCSSGAGVGVNDPVVANDDDCTGVGTGKCQAAPGTPLAIFGVCN